MSASMPARAAYCAMAAPAFPEESSTTRSTPSSAARESVSAAPRSLKLPDGNTWSSLNWAPQSGASASGVHPRRGSPPARRAGTPRTPTALPAGRRRVRRCRGADVPRSQARDRSRSATARSARSRTFGHRNGIRVILHSFRTDLSRESFPVLDWLAGFRNGKWFLQFIDLGPKPLKVFCFRADNAFSSLEYTSRSVASMNTLPSDLFPTP